MKPAVASNYAATLDQGHGSAEILILPDGRVLAHNITPALAVVLAELAPQDETMRLRASSHSPAPSADSSSSLPAPRS